MTDLPIGALPRAVRWASGWKLVLSFGKAVCGACGKKEALLAVAGGVDSAMVVQAVPREGLGLTVLLHLACAKCPILAAR